MYNSQYETHVMTNPSLPFIFHTDIVLAHQAQTIRSNWHTNIELLHCIEGEGQVILDGRSMTFNVGDTVCIPEFTLSDNKTAAEELIVMKTVVCPSGVIVTVPMNSNAITVSQEGVYKFTVMVVDGDGYVHNETWSVTVTEKK